MHISKKIYTNWHLIQMPKPSTSRLSKIANLALTEMKMH